MRVRRTRTETERETETGVETGKGKGRGRGRMTNAGMATVGREAAGQAGADAHAAAVIRETGGASGKLSDGTVQETTLFHLPFTTCTLLQLRPNKGPTDVVTISQSITFFKAHLHTVVLKGDHNFAVLFPRVLYVSYLSRFDRFFFIHFSLFFCCFFLVSMA